MSALSHRAFDPLFTEAEAASICDLALTDAARALVQTTGANGNLFPCLEGLAEFRNGRQKESTLCGVSPKTVGLLLALGLIRLNSRRFYELSVTVDPSKRNGLVNWSGEENI